MGCGLVPIAQNIFIPYKNIHKWWGACGGTTVVTTIMTNLQGKNTRDKYELIANSKLEALWQCWTKEALLYPSDQVFAPFFIYLTGPNFTRSSRNHPRIVQTA